MQAEWTTICTTIGSLCVAADLIWLTKISDVYKEDEWTKKLVRHLWDDITKDKAGEDSEGILVL